MTDAGGQSPALGDGVKLRAPDNTDHGAQNAGPISKAAASVKKTFDKKEKHSGDAGKGQGKTAKGQGKAAKGQGKTAKGQGKAAVKGQGKTAPGLAEDALRKFIAILLAFFNSETLRGEPLALVPRFLKPETNPAGWVPWQNLPESAKRLIGEDKKKLHNVVQRYVYDKLLTPGEVDREKLRELPQIFEHRQVFSETCGNLEYFVRLRQDNYVDPEEYWGKQENRLKKNREAMQAAGMDDDDPDFDLLADLLVEKMRIDVQVAQE